MAKCKACFSNKNVGGRVMRRENAGVCDVCNPPTVVSPAEDACVCPPIGEPRLLTLLAPVVFDECGINLCRVVEDLSCLFPEVDFEDEDIEAIQLQVIDIDFNIDPPSGSRVETLTRRPNCIRVTLTDIDVTFAAKLLDENCRVVDEVCFTLRYLPSEGEEDPSFDQETNPSSVAVDLYAPYGVSYDVEDSSCVATLNFLGFIEEPIGRRNDELRQGIDAQALAKIVNLDIDADTAAIGLTIYLKSVYFVQYKVPHEGLCVPPKCVLVEEEAINACVDFVEGDLLEQSIQPLEVCCRPKTIKKHFKPVVDPTPAEPCDC